MASPRSSLRDVLGYSSSSSASSPQEPSKSAPRHAQEALGPGSEAPTQPLSPQDLAQHLGANFTLDPAVKRKAAAPLDPPSPSKRPKQESETPSAAAPPAKRIIPFPEKPAVIEERNGEIEFRVVNNDGERESTIILTGLKCIFQKQLPKMPKDYIARLVYDRTHLSIAIVKKPLEVVGYVRPLPLLPLYSVDINQWHNVPPIPRPPVRRNRLLCHLVGPAS